MIVWFAAPGMPVTFSVRAAGATSRPAVSKVTCVADRVAVPPLMTALASNVFAPVLVNVTLSARGVLCESYTWIAVVALWPTWSVLLRFPWYVTAVVFVPAAPVPNGTRIELLPGTWKPGWAADPSPTFPVRCTRYPVFGSIRNPPASTANDPARLYAVAAPLLTTKNPRPWMAASRLRPVGVTVPWPNRLSMDPTPTPNPSCAGFVPPVVAVGAEPGLSVWYTRSLNSVRCVLYPVVFRFARLFPTTSSACEFAWSPVEPVNSAVSDIGLPRRCES